MSLKNDDKDVSDEELELKKIEETLNTYSHMFSTVLDSVVSVIDSFEDT